MVKITPSTTFEMKYFRFTDFWHIKLLELSKSIIVIISILIQNQLHIDGKCAEITQSVLTSFIEYRYQWLNDTINSAAIGTLEHLKLSLSEQETRVVLKNLIRNITFLHSD